MRRNFLLPHFMGRPFMYFIKINQSLRLSLTIFIPKKFPKGLLLTLQFDKNCFPLLPKLPHDSQILTLWPNVVSHSLRKAFLLFSIWIHLSQGLRASKVEMTGPHSWLPDGAWWKRWVLGEEERLEPFISLPSLLPVCDGASRAHLCQAPPRLFLLRSQLPRD